MNLTFYSDVTAQRLASTRGWLSANQSQPWLSILTVWYHQKLGEIIVESKATRAISLPPVGGGLNIEIGPTPLPEKSHAIKEQQTQHAKRN